MNLVTILENLLVPCTSTIKQAQNDIMQAFEYPETYGELVNIMANNDKASIRQYAALLLRKQLSKESNYQCMPYETKLCLKSTLLTLIARETVRCISANMIEILAYIFVHESSCYRIWIDESLLRIIEWLKSASLTTIELGAFVLLKIADVAPELFLERFQIIKEVFNATFLAIEADWEMPVKVLQYILKTMSILLPEMADFPEVENYYEDTVVPRISNLLRKMVIKKAGGDCFACGLEILSSMIENAPVLLDTNLEKLVDLIIFVSRDDTCDEEWRTSCLMWLCLLINHRSGLLIRLELVEVILKNVFEILATEPESEDPNEFLTISEQNTALAAATVVIDTVALQIPAKNFFETLLRLMEQAFYDTINPLRRRAVFIVMAAIAEGCRDVICDKHLPSMVMVLKEGLEDVMSSVRNAALYAITQFCEYLQPEFFELSCGMLPVLLTYAQSAVIVPATGHILDVKSTERLFYALEAFCCAIDDGMHLFIDDIMKLIFQLLNTSSVVANIQAVNLIKALANANAQKLMPWLEELMEKLRSIIIQASDINQVGNFEELRQRTLDALAEIIRNLSDFSLPYAEESICFGIQRLRQTKNIDERSSLLNFMGALATYFGEDFSRALPVVMQSIEICLTLNDSGAVGDQNNNDCLALIENDDNDADQDHCKCENPYIEAKEQALYTIFELTEACPLAFLEHGKALYERLFNETDDCPKGTFLALNAVTIVWLASEPDGDGKFALIKLIKHYLDLIAESFETTIVAEAVKALGELISDIEVKIFENAKELEDLIAGCILCGLKFGYKCQRSLNTTCDLNSKEKNVLKNVFYLLECFGQSISSQKFAVYFAKMESFLILHIQSANLDSHESLLSTMIGSLGEYYKPLGTDTQHYFFKHYQLLMNATQQHSSNTLRNAIHALGQLFYFAGEIAYSHYDDLLHHLSCIIKSEPKAYIMQSVVATLARLILKNVKLVPLEQTMPFMIEKLSIISDEDDNEVVIECLKYLLSEVPEPLRFFMPPILAKAFNVLAYDLDSESLTNTTFELLKNLRKIFPCDYARVSACKDFDETKNIIRQRLPEELLQQIM